MLIFSRLFSTLTVTTVKERRKTWEKTRFQNLARHKSGSYYARAFAGGKEIWNRQD